MKRMLKFKHKVSFEMGILNGSIIENILAAFYIIPVECNECKKPIRFIHKCGGF